jgi:NADH:quinone reductase (non-electrogenic)
MSGRRLIAPLTVGVTAAALLTSSYIHLHLASTYRHNTASFALGEELIFRLQGAVTAVTAVVLLTWRRRTPELLVFSGIVLLGSALAVVTYRYIDVGRVVILPNLYEPIWYREKAISAIVEAAGGTTALVMVRPALHAAKMRVKSPVRILIVGGGYIGMNAARILQRRLELREGGATVTVVDPNSHMTYQPFLPEAAAGSLDPRHVVIPLRTVLPECTVVTGRVTAVIHAERRAAVTSLAGVQYDLPYDHLVFAVGSVARILPIPGLDQVGIGFKSVQEAIYLRNQVVSQLDAASTAMDPAIRERELTFLVVGGGFAGIECVAELEDLARSATRLYPSIGAQDMRWVVVEASPRVLPEVSPELSEYTARQLRSRGIRIVLDTRVDSLIDGHVELNDGTSFDAGTVIWTAGGKANPLLSDTDLPVDERARLCAESSLKITGLEQAWTAGDVAAVPDLAGPPGATCAPTAQHAVRQSRRLANNIVLELRGKTPRPYRHRSVGAVASLGLYKGVAEIYGVKLRGFPAWFTHRSYHMAQIPTLNRKVRIVAEWTVALLFRREIAALGAPDDPRAAFRDAAHR